MARGGKCLYCKGNRCEDNGTHHYCPDCKAVFWDFKNHLTSSGSGAGRKTKCHNCGKQTLLPITENVELITVFRCSTCNAVLIRHNQS